LGYKKEDITNDIREKYIKLIMDYVKTILSQNGGKPSFSGTKANELQSFKDEKKFEPADVKNENVANPPAINKNTSLILDNIIKAYFR